MQTHSFHQGSPEWHAHRARHFNASDAPAMLGCSPYKSRTQLLREHATGAGADVDERTQRLFDNGHRYEALARPLAEEIIGQDLYPVVGSEGRLSASFDGLTMLEESAFEHKSLNDELRACFDDIDTIAPEYRDVKAGRMLPMHYRVQMEQQCIVSGAKRVLFMASKWAGTELIEHRYCWYMPDPELRAKIITGWQQFEVDLEQYQHEVVAEAVGVAPEALPALRIEVTGVVTASNLHAFREHAIAVFQAIKTDLATDQDFADADKTAKWCGDIEDRLAAAKQHALSQTESIDELFRAIDAIAATARAKRLELEKLVKARKEEIRAEIVQGGARALSQHVAALNARLGEPYMPAIAADFAGAVKGKKTVASQRDAVDTVLANAKIDASATADRIDANLKHLREHAGDYPALFPDTATIVLKAADDFAALVSSRIAEHERQEAARRQREADAQAARAAAAPAATPVVAPAPPAVAVAAAPRAAPAPAAADERPTMTLVQIAQRLGFALTADFLRTLGFEATRDRSAALYRPSDFGRICDALVQHVVKAKGAA